MRIYGKWITIYIWKTFRNFQIVMNDGDRFFSLAQSSKFKWKRMCACLRVLRPPAIGCPDLRNIADGWQRRAGDTLAVGCNYSTETWYLACKDTRWVGDIGNCTSAVGRRSF